MRLHYSNIICLYGILREVDEVGQHCDPDSFKAKLYQTKAKGREVSFLAFSEVKFSSTLEYPGLLGHFGLSFSSRLKVCALRFGDEAVEQDEVAVKNCCVTKLPTWNARANKWAFKNKLPWAPFGGSLIIPF